jgi:hemolysin activation/secretion protein
VARRLQRTAETSRIGFWRNFVKTRILSSLATIGILAGLVALGSALNAQDTPSTPSSPPDQQSQPQTTQPPAAQQPSPNTPDAQQPAPPQNSPEQNDAAGTSKDTDVQEFSGTVTKVGDKYVLRDDAGHTYDIDHQAEVSKFDGKRVRVKGTLDETGKKILVK